MGPGALASHILTYVYVYATETTFASTSTTPCSGRRWWGFTAGSFIGYGSTEPY